MMKGAYYLDLDCSRCLETSFVASNNALMCHICKLFLSSSSAVSNGVTSRRVRDVHPIESSGLLVLGVRLEE